MCLSNNIDVYQEILNPLVRERIRDNICNNYDFLFHRAEFKFIDKIRDSALEPREIECFTGFNRTLNRRHVGVECKKILCFSPKAINHMVRCDDKQRILLAFSSGNLTSDIGLDWSFEYGWNFAEQLIRNDRSSLTIEDLILDVFRESESLITGTAIPASSLKVKLESSTNNPEDWPFLVDTCNSDKFHFL